MNFTLEDVRTLLDRTNGPCVSLFMPTHQAGPETQQDPIRLKNLLKEAEQQLTEKGVRSTEARTWLEPLSQLLQDQTFWRHQDEGLAAFIAEGWHRIFRLPLSFPELLTVESRFYLKPVLPLFISGGRFYLLALSQNKIRFFTGSREGLKEIRLEGIPHSMTEAFQSPSGEQSLQFHTGAPSAGGQRAAMFHGQGGGDDEAKERIQQFFQQIDKGMTAYLKNHQSPLFLTGVDYLHPLYQAVNTYPHLREEGLQGNYDEKSSHELHKHIRPLVESHFEQTVSQAIARCEELLGTAKASNDIPSVALAAAQGKIETLFVAQEIQQWGRIDLSQNRVELEQQKSSESREILDFTAGQTLLKSGTVYTLPQQQIPGKTNLAAIFRY